MFCATAAFAAFLAACGGSTGFIAPPPPTGGYTNANLKGQYAFSMVGVSANCSVMGGSCGAYLARVGSFIADGNGNILGGLEDVLDLGSAQPATVLSLTGGTYQIQPNGRGTLTLTSASGGLPLSITIKSNGAGYLMQTDLKASTSGTFTPQMGAPFSTGSLNGSYVFDFSGVSLSASTAAPISIIGQMTATGNGVITGGTLDVNDGNSTAGPSGALAIPASAYQLDSTNGTSFGRATMTLNGRTYALYIVDATHLKALEEDALGGASGDAFLQSGSIPASNAAFTGSFVYFVGGASKLGSQGPTAREARFTADGTGTLTAISCDENYNGTYTHIGQGSNISSATYSIDTAHAGSGRGTFTFTDSQHGTRVYVFYMSSPTQAVLQDTSTGIIADGSMFAQSAGPFTLPASTANYIFAWNGVRLGSSTPVPFEENFVGQYALTGAATPNIAGIVDYVELGLASTQDMFTGVGISGTLTMSGDGTNGNAYSIHVSGSPATTVNFLAYFVNADTVFLVCKDSNRTTAGIAALQ